MSGGGNSRTPTPSTTPAPATRAPVPTQTFESFVPEQQGGLLAQQMAMGGYGDANTNAGLLNGLYRDVTMPVISRPDQIAQWLTQAGISPASGTASGTGSGRTWEDVRNGVPYTPPTGTGTPQTWDQVRTARARGASSANYGNRDQNRTRAR